MKVSNYIVVPALVAVGLFAVSTAYAGNLGEEVIPLNDENCDCEEMGHDVNTDPQPPAPATPEPVHAQPSGGEAEHGKNGERPSHNMKGGGGTGSVHVRQRAQVVCVIDGQIVYVRRVQDCSYHPQPVVQYAPRKAKRAHKKARVVVQQNYDNGGDYVVMQQPHVQYYSPASPAATKQARKRAAKAAASYGYGEGYYVQPQVVVKQYRKKRKVRYAQPIYMPAPDYSGTVIHYGPLVTKGGAY